ncbi:MAG TPA: hypothetical protein VN223_04655, partial [Candidatus Elarobacter sp.]|nr:hypothetical protein [Candidatus Elarobacter sp.]
MSQPASPGFIEAGEEESALLDQSHNEHRDTGTAVETELSGLIFPTSQIGCPLLAECRRFLVN